MKNNTDGIGWGFLGAGSISATVAQEVRNFGGGKFVAVCGRNLERTKTFADTHGFEAAYDQPDALLNDQRVDAVYIALPHSLHVETILRALDAGKHVLCEKPFAMTAEEATRVIAHVMAHPRSQSLVIAEGFMVRHHPQWKWILETIASGQIGKVRAIQAHSCLMLPAGNPGTRLPGEGSLLLDIGCYSVHLVRTIAGAEPRQISARMEFAANTQRDNLIRADLTFDGCYAQIFVASTMRPARRIHVLGTEGSIEVMNPIHPSPDGTSPVRLTNAAGVSEKSFPRAPQYALQFQDFSMAVNEQRAPLVTLADALANAKALDAIRASAKAGGATVGV